MPDFIVDPANLVLKEPPGTGDTFFDANRDIYSAWKRAFASQSGVSAAPVAFIPEGGTPIGSTGTFTGQTLVLTNGWKIQAADHAHQVTVNGNLFSDDGVVSVATQSFNTTVFVNSSVNAQGIRLDGATAEQTQMLETILNILQADERVRGSLYQKLHKDTGDVLINKAVTRSGNDIDLVEQ